VRNRGKRRLKAGSVKGWKVERSEPAAPPFSLPAFQPSFSSARLRSESWRLPALRHRRTTSVGTPAGITVFSRGSSTKCRGS